MFDDEELSFLPLLIASVTLFLGGFYMLVFRPFMTQQSCFLFIFCFTSGAPTFFGIDSNVFVALVMFGIGAVILLFSTRMGED